MRKRDLQGLLGALIPTLKSFIEQHVAKQIATRDKAISDLRREFEELKRKSAT